MTGWILFPEVAGNPEDLVLSYFLLVHPYKKHSAVPYAPFWISAWLCNTYNTRHSSQHRDRRKWKVQSGWRKWWAIGLDFINEKWQRLGLFHLGRRNGSALFLTISHKIRTREHSIKWEVNLFRNNKNKICFYAAETTCGIHCSAGHQDNYYRWI